MSTGSSESIKREWSLGFACGVAKATFPRLGGGRMQTKPVSTQREAPPPNQPEGAWPVGGPGVTVGRCDVGCGRRAAADDGWAVRLARKRRRANATHDESPRGSRMPKMAVYMHRRQFPSARSWCALYGCTQLMDYNQGSSSSRQPWWCKSTDSKFGAPNNDESNRRWRSI